MGANSSKQVESCVSLLSSTILNSAVKQSTSCQSNTVVGNQQVVSIDGTAYSTCVSNFANAKNWSADDVLKVCAPLQTTGDSISNISQTAQVNITTTCTLTSNQVQQAQQDVMNAINQSLTNSTDDAGQFLKSLGVALGGKSTDNTDIATKISNQVSQTMTVDVTNTFINDYAVKQSQVVSINGASKSQIQGVSQQIAMQGFAEMIATNSVLNSAVQSVTNQVTSAATSSSQLFPGLWGVINNALGGYFQSLQGLELAVAACVVCCVCATCISCLGGSYIFMSQGGSNVLSHGINVAGSKF